MASKRLTLFTVTVGSFLATLNLSSVNVALPSMTAELPGWAGGPQLVAVGYVAVVTLLLIPFGRLGDLVGRRRFYAAGFLLFATGSSLCSIATSIPMVAGFRMLQGVGAAMIIAQGSAIIAAVFPAGERGSPLAWQVMANSLGSASGYIVAGLLVDALGWRSVFWTNAPVAFVGAALAWTVIPRGLRSERAFDVRGAALLAVALGLLVVAVNIGLPEAWPLALGLLAGAGLSFAAFLAWQRRAPHPLLPPYLRRSRVFLGGIFAALFGFMGAASTGFLMTFYLQGVTGLSARLAGLTLLWYSVAVTAASPLSGRLSDRVSARALATVGLLFIAAGLALLSTLGADASAWRAAAMVAVVGIGVGVFASPNNNAVFAAARQEDLGVANGMLGTTRNLGVTLGVSFAGLVLILGAPGHVFPTGAAFAEAMRAPLLIGAGFAVLGACLSLLRGPSGRAAGTGPAAPE
ncbi:MAG: MFS transporter [Halobacteriales archaeon]|nr:MFS transporter [Halobacteriales archaeon]